jgi:hypothetical protein
MTPPWRKPAAEQQMREHLFQQQQQQLFQHQQAQLLQHQQSRLADHEAETQRQAEEKSQEKASLNELLRLHQAQLQDLLEGQRPTPKEMQPLPKWPPLPKNEGGSRPPMPPLPKGPLPKNQNEDGTRRTRPRGGVKSKWITAANRLYADGASTDLIVKMLGACPSSTMAVSKAKASNPSTWWSASANVPQELFDDEQGGS